MHMSIPMRILATFNQNNFKVNNTIYKDVISTCPKEYRRLFGLLKKEIIAPDDLLRDCNCDIIWESSSVDTTLRDLK